MQAVLQSLERQHEEEKRSALERQRQMYEQELQQLRKKLNPERLSTGQSGGPTIGQQGPGQQSHYRSMERLSIGGMSHSSSAQSRLRQWSEDRWVSLNFRNMHNVLINTNLVFLIHPFTCLPSCCFPPVVLLQGGCVGEESSEVEGADSQGEPPGTRSLFHCRWAGTAHRVPSHSADPIRQP